MTAAVTHVATPSAEKRIRYINNLRAGTRPAKSVINCRMPLAPETNTVGFQHQPRDLRALNIGKSMIAHT